MASAGTDVGNSVASAPRSEVRLGVCTRFTAGEAQDVATEVCCPLRETVRQLFERCVGTTGHFNTFLVRGYLDWKFAESFDDSFFFSIFCVFRE